MNTTPFPRAQRCADEAAKRAGLLGYGLRSVQQFQREAVRLANESNMTPAQVARQCVPAKTARLGEIA